MRNKAWQVAVVMAAAERSCSRAAATTRRATAAAAARPAAAAEDRQGRCSAAGLEVVGALGDGRPAVPAEGVRRRRHRGHDHERGERQGDPAAAGRAGDHQRRDGPPARQPRLGLRRGDRGQRQVAGRQGDRLRPPDARHRRTPTTTSRSTTRRSASSRAKGSSSCLDEAGTQNPAVAVLNGSPTDNNATLFKNGYDGVINSKFDSGDWTEVADESVPEWDNQRALTIFEQMLQKADNKIDGVLAANDGLGNAAISAIKQRKLDQIPVTGQDATLQGLQNIVNGDQCMTVYKAIKKEADAASEAGDRARQGRGADAPRRRRSTTAPRRSRRSCSTRSRSTRTTSASTSGSRTSRRRRTSAPESSPPSARSSGCKREWEPLAHGRRRPRPEVPSEEEMI